MGFMSYDTPSGHKATLHKVSYLMYVRRTQCKVKQKSQAIRA